VTLPWHGRAKFQVLQMFIVPPIRNDRMGLGNFGARRGSRTHKGLDFSAEPGTVIYAVDDGEITKIGYCYGDDLKYRYVQITTHDGLDLRYFYTTLQPLLSIGDQVLKGQALCVVQDISSKHSTDKKTMINHYHFEIKEAGQHINPVPYLKKIGVKL
jgi:murein DD-endopeptidase MepM/ murein hydrolase activator NlpD